MTGRGWFSTVSLILLLVLVCFSGWLIGCETDVAVDSELKKDFTYAILLEGETLDPAATFSTWSINELALLYDTLIWEDTDGNLQPGLATEWSHNEDATEFTLKLREDVTFHDGTPFNAEAVKFNLDRIGVDPQTVGKSGAGIKGPYKTTEVLDEYTVKVIFEEPYPAFYSTLVSHFYGVVSPAAVEEYGEDFGMNPVGTGPFIFVSWEKEHRLVVEKNPDYNWGPPFLEAGPPNVETVTMLQIEDDVARVTALEMGEIDMITRVPWHAVQKIIDDEQFNVYQAEAPGMPNGLMLNVQREPMDDLRVRQAISYAVDQQEVVDVVFGGVEKPAYGPLTEAMWAYWPGAENYYNQDLDKAAELLDEAGWKLESDGFRYKDGEQLHLIMIHPPSPVPDLWEMVQASLRDVGINVEIQGLDMSACYEKCVLGEHHLAQLQFAMFDPSGMRTMWGSENAGTGFNWSHIECPEIDELLSRGEAEGDMQKRVEIYVELQELIMENAYMLPLHSYSVAHATAANVEGLYVPPSARHFWLHDIHFVE